MNLPAMVDKKKMNYPTISQIKYLEKVFKAVLILINLILLLLLLFVLLSLPLAIQQLLPPLIEEEQYK